MTWNPFSTDDEPEDRLTDVTTDTAKSDSHSDTGSGDTEDRVRSQPSVRIIERPDDHRIDRLVKTLTDPADGVATTAGAIATIKRQTKAEIQGMVDELDTLLRQTSSVVVGVDHNTPKLYELAAYADLTLALAPHWEEALPTICRHLPALINDDRIIGLGSARRVAIPVDGPPDTSPDSTRVLDALETHKGHPLHHIANDAWDFVAFAAPRGWISPAKETLSNYAPVIDIIEWDEPRITVCAFVFDQQPNRAELTRPSNGGRQTPAADQDHTDGNERTTRSGGGGGGARYPADTSSQDPGTTRSQDGHAATDGDHAPDAHPLTSSNSGSRNAPPTGEEEEDDTQPRDEQHDGATDETPDTAGSNTPTDDNGKEEGGEMPSRSGDQERGSSENSLDAEPVGSDSKDDHGTPSEDAPVSNESQDADQSDGDQPPEYPDPRPSPPDGSGSIRPSSDDDSATASAGGTTSDPDSDYPAEEEDSSSVRPHDTQPAESSTPSADAGSSSSDEDSAGNSASPRDTQDVTSSSGMGGAIPPGGSSENSDGTLPTPPDLPDDSSTSDKSGQQAGSSPAATVPSQDTETPPAFDDPESKSGSRIPSFAPPDEPFGPGIVPAGTAPASPDPNVVDITEHVLHEISFHATAHDGQVGHDGREVYGTLYCNDQGLIRYHHQIENETFLEQRASSITFRPPFYEFLRHLASIHNDISHRLCGDVHSHPGGIPEQSPADKRFARKVWRNPERNHNFIVGLDDGDGPGEWTVVADGYEVRKCVNDHLIRVRAYAGGTNEPKQIRVHSSMGG